MMHSWIESSRSSRHFSTLILVSFASVLSWSSYAESPVPDYYQTPGYDSGRSYQTNQANESVDPFSGVLHLNYVDLVVPGNGGMDIVVQRTYHSLAGQPGVIGSGYADGRTTTGVGWDIHFGRVWPNNTGQLNNTITNVCQTGNISSRDNPVLELPDGSRHVLVDADFGETDYDLISKDNWIGRCLNQQTGDGGLIVYSPDGYEYVFDYFNNVSGTQNAYSVTKITDPNGNWMTIDYLDNGFNQFTIIKQINTSDGRTVTFTYDNSNPFNDTEMIGETWHALLRQVTYGSKTVNYHYTHPASYSVGYYRLDRVDRPDGESWLYQYHTSGNGLYSLKKSTSPNGVVTDYTYDLVDFHGFFPYNTVVKTKAISGGSVASGNWTYNYNPTSSQDETTVVTPYGCERYVHAGYKSTAVSGSLWKIGVLLSKSIYNDTGCSEFLHKEEYDWSPQVIAQQNEFNRGDINSAQVDTETNRALMVSKTITRETSSGTSYVTDYSAHDEYGNPTIVVETGQASRTTNYSYYSDRNKWIVGRLEDETLVGIGTVSRDFDTNGNLLSESHYGVATSYTYHGTGDVKTLKDAENNLATYTNYKRGIPQSESHPEGISLSRVIDDYGNITSTTNGRGKTTSFSYDSLDRITSVTTPRTDDDNISIDWDDTLSGVTRTVTRGSFSETRVFNGHGQATLISAEGVTNTFSYDALGRQLFASYPNGGSTGINYSYDNLGRLISMRHPDFRSQLYNYYDDNRVVLTNERGYDTSYFYRAYGNPDERHLLRIEESYGYAQLVVTEIERNKLGQPESVTQNGITRNYAYNNNYYLTSETHPETGVTQFGRDLVGNMTSSQVAASGVTQYTYDGLNRVDIINYPGSTPDIDYSYDGNNNVIAAIKGDATLSYTYDDNNNLKTEKLEIAGLTNAYNAAYVYNSKDSLEAITYPTGQSISYAPDDLARPTLVSGVIDSISYFPNGQINTLEFENGVTTTLGQHSQRLFPNAVDVVGPTGSLVDMNYLYDETGNVKNIYDPFNGNRSFYYDGINRLTSAAGPWGSGAIVYSKDGNITTKNLGSQNLSYQYDTQNRLQSITGSKPYNFSYDLYGNVTNNGTHSFTYADDSNLVQVGGSNGISYSYDANNQRYLEQKDGDLKVSFYNSEGLLLTEVAPFAATVTEYIYLNKQLVAKRAYCDGDVDSDGDGMSNCFETKYGLDVNNPADKDSDPDNDGLTNLEEYELGINPQNEDTDGDLMSDKFEVDYGLDPNVDDSGLDADGDTYSNLVEFEGDSDPNDPHSIPTGEMLWSFLAEGTPSIGADGTVYVTAMDGKLYAYEPDGTLKWDYPIDLYCDGMAAIGSDGTIYAGCKDGQLYAVNPNGTEKWTLPEGGIPAIGKNGVIYFVNNRTGTGKVYALDPETMFEIWVYEDEDEQFFAEHGLSIASDGTIYAYNAYCGYATDESGYAIDRCDFHAIDHSDGTKKWDYADLGLYLYGVPAIGLDGSIYISVVDSMTNEPWGDDWLVRIVVLNSDGTLQRVIGSNTLYTEYREYTSPTLSTKGLLLTGQNGPAAFNTDHYEVHGRGTYLNNSYSGEWAGEVGHYFAGSTAVGADGVLYVGSVYALEEETGALRWQRSDNGLDFDEVILDSNGIIYSALGAIANNRAAGLSASTWPTATQNIRRTRYLQPCGTQDSDLDGMPDCYERRAALNPDIASDAYEDADGDGLLNFEEYQQGTHPHNADSDGDRMPDLYEVENGLDPLSHDAELDKDGDGVFNYIEYFSDTSPNLDSSLPSVGTLLWTHSLPYPVSAQMGLYVGDSLTNNLGIVENSSVAIVMDRMHPNQIGSIAMLSLFGDTGIVKSDTHPKATMAIDGYGEMYGSPASGYKLSTARYKDTKYDFFRRITSPVAVLYDPQIGDVIYYGEQDRNTLEYRIVSEEGNVAFSYTVGGEIKAAPAVGGDGTVYFGSDDGKVYAIRNDSSFRWEFATGGSVYSQPAIGSDGTIYIGSDDGKIYALQGDDGSKRWEFDTGAPVTASPVLGEDGTVYIGSTNGTFYAIDPATGNQKWPHITGDSIQSSALVGADGTIYIGSNDGYLYALEPVNGGVTWSVDLSAPVGAASPVIDGQGVLYIGAGTQVHAIYTSSKGLANSSWPVYGHDQRHSGYVGAGAGGGNANPQVNITNPSSGSNHASGASVTLQANASDAEDGDLSANIQWSSDLDGALGAGASISVSTLSVGSHSITASVTDSASQVDSAVISLTITGNQLPQVSIGSPASGSTHNQGDAIGFQASAADVEDGDLSAAIIWVSDLDGALGTGASISVSSLSVGTHAITASVVDSGSGSGSSTISLTVSAGPGDAPVLSISAPADNSSFDQGQIVGLQGSATDTEDGDISSGISWSSDIDGVLGTGALVNINTLSVGAHSITAIITDSDSQTASASITITINSIGSNNAPTVSITGPANNSSFTLGSSVSLQGSASDTEDGDLSSGISWSSDLDGVLGIGAQLVVSTLSVGAHTITATVTDSGSTSDSVSIGVTVIPNAGATYSDDLETDQGWVINPNNTDTATGGMWELADPQTTWGAGGSGKRQDGDTHSGTQALVTGPLAGSALNDYDVDGGVTSVRSPNIALPTLDTGEILELSLWYYFAFSSNARSGDYFRVTVVGTAVSQLLIDSRGNPTINKAAVWEEFTAVLDSFAGDTVYLLIEASDESEESLIEAAVDDIQIAVVSSSSGVNFAPPVAYDDTAATNLDTALEVEVLENDMDPDSDPLTLVGVTQGANGVVIFNDATLVYSPNSSSTGTDTFSYTISDGHGGTATAEVTVNVSPGAGEREKVYLNVFETDLGWAVDPDGTDTASSGIWELADPETTWGSGASGKRQDGDTHSGTQALVTGPLAGSGAADYDVDGGVTSVRSPNITLPTLNPGEALKLSLWYYFAFSSNAKTGDYFRVTVVGAAVSQLLIDSRGNPTINKAAVWEEFTAVLDSFAGDTVYLLIEAADEAETSLIEAAVDDVRITVEAE